MRDDLKVGVFLCECGGNIADIVDLDKVRSELDVEFIGQFENLCSLNGRKIIRDAIFDHDLDRVVVAACSPISHEKTFQDYVNAVRFRKACKLIAEGKDSMISISMESGFSDYRYFSRTFMENYGMTPAEYRRKANAVVPDKNAQSQSSHSQERFMTRGQSLGILQSFRKQLQ